NRPPIAGYAAAEKSKPTNTNTTLNAHSRTIPPSFLTRRALLEDRQSFSLRLCSGRIVSHLRTAPLRGEVVVSESRASCPACFASVETLLLTCLSDQVRIGDQCTIGGPGVPSDHSSATMKKVVTRCSWSYAAITGEPGRLAPQLFS